MIFVLLGCVLFVQVRAYLRATILETQSRRARQIAETLVANLPSTGEPFVVSQIKTLYAPELGDRFIRVARSDGSVLYRSGPPADQSFDPASVAPVKAAGSSEARRMEVLPDGRTLLVAQFPVRTASGDSYIVEVGTSGEPVNRLVQRLLVLLALGLPLVAILAAGGGYLLVGRTLSSVEQITRKAESISQHNLAERLPVPATGDELERLSLALNNMIRRLDDAFATSTRFVADASHELRTPLTIVQGELEGLAKDPATPVEFREQLGSLLEEVERLARIVQQLFALSRLDAGEAHTESACIDLSGLAVGTAEQMSLLAEDKKIELSRAESGPIYVMGDRSRLRQVIVNLLDNAIKYTDRGGAVVLTTGGSEGWAYLEVSDSGVGIAPLDLPRVFERFFRARRDHSNNDVGAGLGLAIVQSICVAHGGRVEVESVLGKGSRFRVFLPRVQLKESFKDPTYGF